MPHSSVFLTSCVTHPLPLCIFHISRVMWVLLCCFATRAHLCIFLLPTTGIPLSSFWQVEPGPLPEIAVSVFREVLGRANTFSLLSLALPPPTPVCISLEFTSSSPWSLALVFALPCMFCFYFCIVPPRTCLWTVSLLGSLLHILPYFLDDAIPSILSSPFRYFLPYGLIGYGRQPLFWHVLCFVLPCQRSDVSLRFVWVHSQFCSCYCITRRTWASYCCSSFLQRYSCRHLYCFQLFYEVGGPFPYSCRL